LWSVFTRNFVPNKYCFHLTKECIISNISLSYVDFVFSLGLNFRLSNAMGLLSSISTTPNTALDASHSRSNYLEKYDSNKTRVDVIKIFNLLKHASDSSFHLNASFFNNVINGPQFVHSFEQIFCSTQ